MWFGKSNHQLMHVTKMFPFYFLEQTTLSLVELHYYYNLFVFSYQAHDMANLFVSHVC